VLAAIYTSFFSLPWMREILKPSVEILAGFPSVVIGFFMLTVAADWIRLLTHSSFRLNALVGGIGVGLVVIPIIFTLSEDALNAVPREYKEAALSLGATQWQAAYRVLIPAAWPGIFAGVVLGFARAFGETMIALMATGNAALHTWDFLKPARTMAATIGSEMAEVVFGDTHYAVLFLVGLVLFIVAFFLNFLAEVYIKSLLEKRLGKR